jgi:hypothetical protein
MTSGQFWLILIFIGGGFWATIVLLEGSRKNLRFFADCAAKKWPLRGSLKSGRKAYLAYPS